MSIYRERVTWCHPFNGKGKAPITHPMLWVYVDDNDTARYFDTKAEAVARRDQDVRDKAASA